MEDASLRESGFFSPRLKMGVYECDMRARCVHVSRASHGSDPMERVLPFPAGGTEALGNLRVNLLISACQGVTSSCELLLLNDDDTYAQPRCADR